MGERGKTDLYLKIDPSSSGTGYRVALSSAWNGPPLASQETPALDSAGPERELLRRLAACGEARLPPDTREALAGELGARLLPPRVYEALESTPRTASG